VRETLQLREKDAKITDIPASFTDVIVAYSGGDNFTFLLKKAAELLTERAPGVVSRCSLPVRTHGAGESVSRKSPETNGSGA